MNRLSIATNFRTGRTHTYYSSTFKKTDPIYIEGSESINDTIGSTARSLSVRNEQNARVREFPDAEPGDTRIAQVKFRERVEVQKRSQS